MIDKIMCPFRKRTEKCEDGSTLEYFMECDKEKCYFCEVDKKELAQMKYESRPSIWAEYSCFHPQRMRVKRISENHFIYTDVMMAKGVLEVEDQC